MLSKGAGAVFRRSAVQAVAKTLRGKSANSLARNTAFLNLARTGAAVAHQTREFSSKGGKQGSTSKIVPVPDFEDEDEGGEVPTLSDALATEIAEEVAAESVDQELEDIKVEIKKTFSIKDEAGKGVVTLEAKINGAKVLITFDCQDEAETGMDMNELQMPELNEGNEDELPEIGFGINFVVRITSSTGDKMVIDCVASQELQVLNVQHVPAGKNEDDGDLYGGPIFDQLSENLQDSIFDFLAEHKVDEDLAFFILSYSRSKEESEYLHWLNSMLNTVESIKK